MNRVLLVGAMPNETVTSMSALKRLVLAVRGSYYCSCGGVSTYPATCCGQPMTAG